jgi:hypothetical protein
MEKERGRGGARVRGKVGGRGREGGREGGRKSDKAPLIFI